MGYLPCLEDESFICCVSQSYQTLMNVLLELTTVMAMLVVLTQREALFAFVTLVSLVVVWKETALVGTMTCSVSG